MEAEAGKGGVADPEHSRFVGSRAHERQRIVAAEPIERELRYLRCVVVVNNVVD